MTAKALAFVVAILVLPHHHYHHPSTIQPVDALCFSFSPIPRVQEQDFRRQISHRSSPRPMMRVYLNGTNSDNNDDGSGDDDDNRVGNDDITIPSLIIDGTVNRRQLLLLPSVAVLTASTFIVPFSYAQHRGGNNNSILNRKNDNKDNIAKYFCNVLESSSLYRVKTTPDKLTAATTTSSLNRGETLPPKQKPSVYRLTNQRLLKDLQSKRAIFLGEHHPDGRDHLLQAALIRSLYYNYDRMNNHCSAARSGDSITTTTSSSSSSSRRRSPVMAVGIEAVQQQFQPALDAYVAGTINENELKKATEWETRWYWSFDVYRPILKICRDLGLPLLALDISTEDRIKVETGGLESIDLGNYEKYVPDPDAFLEFGNTKAYLEYVNYTLKPPYDLQSRIQSSSLGRRSNSKNRGYISNNKSDITFSNFVARQMLRDEGMASASISWLLENPTGLLVGCIGINHATFGCGVPGRVARTLSSSSRIPDECGKERVVSILINPEPLNTGTELNTCNKNGTLLTDEEDEDENVYWRRPIFVPNKNNQVCIQNSVELQNYALQLEYVSLSSTNTTVPTSQQRRQFMKEAASVMQATPGENVLALSDYLIFSPRED